MNENERKRKEQESNVWDSSPGWKTVPGKKWMLSLRTAEQNTASWKGKCYIQETI